MWATGLFMQALEALDAQPKDNIFLAGDMNWNDDKDGRPQLSPGWCVSSQLHPPQLIA